MFAYVENQRKFRKRGTAINAIFFVLMPDSGRPFSKVNDIRSYDCVPVRGAPYVPRLSFKPFHSAVSEGLHVLSDFRPKPLIGKILVCKRCFWF